MRWHRFELRDGFGDEVAVYEEDRLLFVGRDYLRFGEEFLVVTSTPEAIAFQRVVIPHSVRDLTADQVLKQFGPDEARLASAIGLIKDDQHAR